MCRHTNFMPSHSLVHVLFNHAIAPLTFVQWFVMVCNCSMVTFIAQNVGGGGRQSNIDMYACLIATNRKPWNARRNGKSAMPFRDCKERKVSSLDREEPLELIHSEQCRVDHMAVVFLDIFLQVAYLT